MKKIVFLLIVLLLSSYLFARGADEASVAQITYVGPLGKYDPPIEVHAVKAVAAELTIDTLKGNLWWEMYRDELGINLVYDWIATGNQYIQKVNIMLAGSEMPDVMQVNYRQMALLYEAGLIADLTDAWEISATAVTKELMRGNNPTAFEMAMFAGKLYGIPVTTPIEETAQVLWVRTDWLDKLGFDMPETMDELIDVMRAFSREDPDGNGVDDTFGMTLTKNLYEPVHGMVHFANSYHAYPNAWIDDGNSNLVYGSILPEMKTVLSILNQMYNEGLIEPEAFVKDMAKVGESVTQSKVGVMYGMQWAPFIGPRNLWVEDNNSDFQALPLLPSDSDKVLVQVYNNTNEFVVIRKGFEYPDVAVQFFNAWNRHLRGPHIREFDEWYEYQAQMFDGSFVTPETGHWNAKRWDLINQALETGDISNFGDRHLIKELYTRLENFKNGNLENEFDVPGCAMLFNCGEAFDVIKNDYMAKDRLILDQRGSYASENYIAKIAILNQLELETFTRIITDDLPVDEFNDFVKQWKELGGDEIITELNDWYQGK